MKRWAAGKWSESPDAVVMEEPLQLLLDGEPLSVVMRTPGNDIELTMGLLYAEGVIQSAKDVKAVRISAEAGERGREELRAQGDEPRVDRLDDLAAEVHDATRRPRGAVS